MNTVAVQLTMLGCRKSDKMKLLKSLTFVVLAITVQSCFALADVPTLPNVRIQRNAENSRWEVDGTRTKLLANVEHFLGKGSNPFGSLVGDGAEGVTPPGSDVLSEYIAHVLGGIPGAEVSLRDGKYFYSGAEPHNATNEAATITQGRGGKILGLVLLQRHTTVATLTLFIADGQQIDAATRAYLVAWAQADTAALNASSSEVLDVEIKTCKIATP
jgi:hypothetical protein